MKVNVFTDPVVYQEHVGKFLRNDETRTYLLLGILYDIAVNKRYKTYQLYSVTDDNDAVQLIALQTPPFKLLCTPCTSTESKKAALLVFSF